MYGLECSLCEELYIGETGRTFRERTREHYRSVANMSNKKSDSDLGLYYLVSHKEQKVPNQ